MYNIIILNNGNIITFKENVQKKLRTSQSSANFTSFRAALSFFFRFCSFLCLFSLLHQFPTIYHSRLSFAAVARAEIHDHKLRSFTHFFVYCYLVVVNPFVKFKLPLSAEGHTRQEYPTTIQVVIFCGGAARTRDVIIITT